MWSEGEEFKDSHEKLKIKSGYTVRGTVIRLCSGTSHSGNVEKTVKIDQLMDIMKKQSEQIDMLTKIVNSKQRPRENRYYKPQQQQRTPLCNGCNEPGHKVANCPNKEKSRN